LGAAEPRYVLQSPGLVENCLGLYVPLLEFNQNYFAWFLGRYFALPYGRSLTDQTVKIAVLGPIGTNTEARHKVAVKVCYIGELWPQRGRLLALQQDKTDG
jgi:hypothetical protein